MSTASVVPAVQFDAEKKLHYLEYQPTDANGNPVGRLQRFEDATVEGLTAKIAAGHFNATVKYHEERKARKLERFVDPDPAKPLNTFEGRSATADERTRIANGLKKPEEVVEALALADEVRFGAPTEEIRARLRYSELQERLEAVRRDADAFLSAHPDYYKCPQNEADMIAWLEKKEYAPTLKNLELAFEALRDDLVQKPSTSAVPAAPAASNSPAPSAAATTEPPSSGGNSAPAMTTAPGNSGESAAVRATEHSSSGLSGRNSVPLPANASLSPTETSEITPEYIASLSAEQYALKMRDPKFVAAIDKLYAKK